MGNPAPLCYRHAYARDDKENNSTTNNSHLSTTYLQIDFFIVKFIYHEIQKNPADYF